MPQLKSLMNTLNFIIFTDYRINSSQLYYEPQSLSPLARPGLLKFLSEFLKSLKYYIAFVFDDSGILVKNPSAFNSLYNVDRTWRAL